MGRQSIIKLLLTSLVWVLTFSSLQARANETNDALALFQNHQYEAALSQFRKLHKANPKDADLTFYLARSLYRQQQLAEAESLLEDNLERHPQHVNSHYLMGSVKLSRVADVNIFRKAGLAKDAVNAWEQTLVLEPDHAEALYGVTSFYFSAPGIAGGDKELAQKKLARLETLSPPWADLTRASLEARAENYDKAESLFKSAIEGIPHRAFPTMMLANLYIAQDQFEQAHKTLQDYAAREKTWNDPGEEPIALMAGRIYEGLEEPDKAAQSYRRVLEGPASSTNMIKQAKEALESIQAR